MAGHAPVGVHDDLATGQTGVAHRTADNKATGRVDVHLVAVVGELLGDRRTDDLFDQVGSDHRVPVDAVVVLGRHHHRPKTNRRVPLVVKGHLGLGVRSEVGDGSRLADLGVAFSHSVGQVNGQRHEHVGLIARKAEHHSLVAGALAV